MNSMEKSGRTGTLRRGFAAALVGAIGLTGLGAGCTGRSPGVVDPGGVPVTAGTTIPERLDHYLQPYRAADDGARRKVGSEWFVKVDGAWARED